MADKAVTDLTAGTIGDGSEVLHAVQGANSRKFTFTKLLNWILIDRIATAAQFRDNTSDKVLSTDQIWSAADEVTLTDAATIAVDMDTFINGVVTLGDNRTLGNPTNPKVGQSGHIRVVQDGTGSRTLSFGSNYEFAGGSAPTLTTTASAEDVLFYHVISSTRILITNVLDIS